MNAWIDSLNALSATWFDLLVRASWQGAIALGVVWLIARFVSRLPATHKVWLWRLAFLKLLAGLIWLSPVVLPILPQQAPAIPVVTETVPAALPQTQAVVDLRLPAMTIEPSPSSLHLRAWLFLAWCAALFICALRVVRHWRETQRLLGGSGPLRSRALEECLRALSERLRLKSAPSIRESPVVSSPLLVGIFRPQIILPCGLADSVSSSRLELMLAHELAHLRRRDLLWLWLFTLGETLFFFHPVVWLARREWTLATEAACDEMAIRVTRQTPRDYGEMLIDIVATTSRHATPLVAVGIIENAHTLKRRLKLMITTRTRVASIGGIALISIATLALVPWKLTAQDANAEAVAKLKEENAKLRQELEAARKDAEVMRVDAELMRKRAVDEREVAILRREADRQVQLAREKARNVERQKRAVEDIRIEQQRRMEALQDNLRRLRTQFTDDHPSVRKAQTDLELLETEMAAANYDPLEPPRKPELPRIPEDERATKRFTRHQDEQRALLQKEIELAERHVEYVRKAMESGRELPASLLAAQRELLDVKLQMARLGNSKAEERAVLLQQLNAAEDMLKEYKKRIELGRYPTGAEIPFEREVLRIKRQLASPELQN